MSADRSRAMNADIQAFIAPFLPVQPCGLTIDDREGWGVWQGQFNAAWRDAMARTDHIRLAHGLVPCDDSPGWKFA